MLAACPTLQDLGTAIIHNLACKEVKTVVSFKGKINAYTNIIIVINKYWMQCFMLLQVFDDVAIELAMALLQFFSTKPNEEHLFRTMKALGKFVTVMELTNNDMHLVILKIKIIKFAGIARHTTIGTNDWPPSENSERNQ